MAPRTTRSGQDEYNDEADEGDDEDKDGDEDDEEEDAKDQDRDCDRRDDDDGGHPLSRQIAGVQTASLEGG